MRAIIRPLLVSLSMVLLLSLSDCIRLGSDLIEDELDSRTNPAEAPTATPTPEATQPPGTSARPTPTPTPTPTPVPELSERDIEQFLIQTEDLSPEWRSVALTEPFSAIPGAEDIDGILVSAYFQQTDLGPYLGHLVLYTDSEADAQTVFEALESELDATDVLDDLSSEVRSWETEPTDFEDLGDETAAFKAVGDTGLIPVEADMVTTRKGQFVSFVVHAQLMTVDTQQTEEFATTAVEKLPASRSEASEAIGQARNAFELARRYVLSGQGTNADE
jgi:hypothetical protein